MHFFQFVWLPATNAGKVFKFKIESFKFKTEKIAQSMYYVFLLVWESDTLMSYVFLLVWESEAALS